MSQMFKISLPDGSVREMPEGSTPADVAAAIGPGLAKAALALQGTPVGPVRLPLVDATEQERTVLAADLTAAGVALA